MSMSANDEPSGRWGQPFRQTPQQWRDIMNLYAKLSDNIQDQRQKARASDTARAFEQEHAQPVSPQEFNTIVTEYRRVKDMEWAKGHDLIDTTGRDGKTRCPEIYWVVDDEKTLIEDICMRPGGHDGDHGEYRPEDDALVKENRLRAHNAAVERFHRGEGDSYDAAQVVQSLMCKDNSLDVVFGCPLRRGHPGPHEFQTIYNDPLGKEYVQREADE